MDKQTAIEFVKVWLNYTMNSKQRLGQCLFNSLYEFDPKLADSIRGTDKDPFHNNSVISTCLIHIFSEEAWQWFTETYPKLSTNFKNPSFPE